MTLFCHHRTAPGTCSLMPDTKRIPDAVCQLCVQTEWKDGVPPSDPPMHLVQAIAPLPLPINRGTCRHLGDRTGLRHCQSCSGNVKLKVYTCNHPEHTETTLPECSSCVHFEAL